MTELTDVCNFADDATFHGCDSSLEDLVDMLEHDANLAIEWFDCNYMKLNQNKCHLGHKSEAIWAKIGQTKIWESKNQKLLGVMVDRQQNFDEHLISLFVKSWTKVKSKIDKHFKLRTKETFNEKFY